MSVSSDSLLYAVAINQCPLLCNTAIYQFKESIPWHCYCYPCCCIPPPFADML